MGWIVRALLALVALVVVAAVVGYFVLRRPDIPYEQLEARYASAASQYVDLPSGVRMHYRDEGQANGPVLLLIHGFASSLHTWEPLVARLGEEYRLISIDLPGHGLTRAPEGYAASIEAFGDEVAAFADTMQLTRFSIAGNSMGGNVAWEYALEHPQQIDGVILVDSAGWADTVSRGGEPLVFRLVRDPVLGPLLRDIDTTRLIRGGLEASFSDTSIADEAMVARYTDFTRAPGHRDILLAMATRERNPATPERLAALANLPVLVIHGDADAIVPFEHGERFRDAISGAEFVALNGIGHLPHEESPDATAQAIQEFLYRVHEGPALATAAQ